MKVNPLCWKVRDRPVYFLASIHVGPPGGFLHGAVVTAAFDASAQVFFEMPPAEMALMPTLGARESGSLADDLGPNLYPRLQQHPSFGPSFEVTKLPFVAAQLGASPFNEIGLTAEWGVEQVLMQRAVTNEQEISGLETAAELVSSFGAISPARVVTGIQNMLDHPELLIESRDRLLAGYCAGDLSALDVARIKIYEAAPDIAALLFTQREERWMSHLSGILAKASPAMIIVGAAHFPGQGGLIDVLRRDGVNLDPISPG